MAGRNFFPLKAKVVGGSSIVVTSTNNNAVKNITQELPAREKVHSDFASATYFDEVIREVFAAQKVVDDDKQPIDCWGLVAAALGNAGNRRSFARGFFRDEPRQAPNTDTSSPGNAREDDAPGAARRLQCVSGITQCTGQVHELNGHRRVFGVIDDAAAGRMATQHLINLGHKRIGFISGPSEYRLSAKRVDGWKAEMDAAGLPTEGLLEAGDFTFSAAS